MTDTTTTPTTASATSEELAFTQPTSRRTIRRRTRAFLRGGEGALPAAYRGRDLAFLADEVRRLQDRARAPQ